MERVGLEVEKASAIALEETFVFDVTRILADHIQSKDRVFVEDIGTRLTAIFLLHTLAPEVEGDARVGDIGDEGASEDIEERGPGKSHDDGVVVVVVVLVVIVGKIQSQSRNQNTSKLSRIQ